MKLARPVADAIRDEGHALGGPGLVALEELGVREFKDRRLHRVERGEHPGDRARPGIGLNQQQARMALRDVEHDRPRFEQGESAFG